MRQKYVIGNWKMNTDLNSGLKLAEEILTIAQNTDTSHVKVVLCAPFTHIHALGQTVAKLPHFALGAQNVSHLKSGAMTGDIAIDMLKSIGVQYVIIGHSERRTHYREDDLLIKEKVKVILEAGLTPVFCCGEAKEIRESGMQNSYVLEQIKTALGELSAEEIKKVVIAYEPVWAIGTGLTASTEQIQELHAAIRQFLADHFGAETAQEISLLYGGSVKANNATEIFALADVDGGLIGGAALVSNEFINIIGGHQKN